MFLIVSHSLVINTWTYSTIKAATQSTTALELFPTCWIQTASSVMCHISTAQVGNEDVKTEEERRTKATQYGCGYVTQYD